MKFFVLIICVIFNIAMFHVKHNMCNISMLKNNKCILIIFYQNVLTMYFAFDMINTTKQTNAILQQITIIVCFAIHSKIAQNYDEKIIQ